MSNKQKYAVIVAGGSGSRMQSDIPKQFLLVDQLPILMHTINAFYAYSSEINVIVVLPSAEIPYWHELCTKHRFDKKVTVTAGGASRFQSVKNGLSIIKDSGLVAIHDGVRPFVSTAVIQQSFAVAEQKGNAVVAVPMKDSLRQVNQDDTNNSVDRAAFRIIQTPQTFQTELLIGAYDTPELTTFTDDASVIEHAGHAIHLIDGTYENIKITTPEDLPIAEVLLKRKNG
ncbi:2-C-methyl-D-erythritol 4-phosphate cytidylyltransferase [Persicobacter psychrovividus]|uniref:2-C-methyl-D-erythritol 4-phosphate cytidylyltransferase n=1 Tax=Persicobacter psychrovividus TaxID=387638 RepID=A0ABM7VG65_9BACT|nr:2-C-methyl-D-erythritol 4-phosphate cytidylyltransferase [Persicobacter psychrovividus]